MRRSHESVPGQYVLSKHPAWRDFIKTPSTALSRTLPPLPLASRIPGPLEALHDRPLLMSSAAGNSLAVAQTDKPDALIRVTLASRKGSIRLARTDGLRFATGGGENILLEFTGSLRAVNAALDGMHFTPARSLAGAASIRIIVRGIGRRGQPILAATVPIEVRCTDSALVDTPFGPIRVQR